MNDRFLPRLLALAATAPDLATMKAVDAYLVGPLLARPLAAVLPLDTPPRPEWFRTAGPIHWLRPGGMGDWAVLAPFIEGTRRLRAHPQDTLWVTGAAFPFAEAYHRQRSGLRVRRMSPWSLATAPAPDLLVQTELFHASAWALAALLRPRRMVAPELPDPRDLVALPPEPMPLTFGRLHPGVAPVPPPPPSGRPGPLVVFAAGTHPSRRLPPPTPAALHARGFPSGHWLGGAPGEPLPPGWTGHPDPLPIPALLTLLAGAGAVLAPDSGPFHLAELLGTPALAYFTSGEWERWAWAGARKVAIQSSFPCTGCIRMALPAPCPHRWGCVREEDAARLAEALGDLPWAIGGPGASRD